MELFGITLFHKRKIQPIKRTEQTNGQKGERTESISQFFDNKHDHDQHRLKETLKMLSVMAVPVLMLISITAVTLHNAQQLNTQLHTAERTLKESLSVASLIGNLQKERGISSLFIGSSGGDDEIKRTLTTISGWTDNSLVAVLAQNREFNFGFDVMGLFVTTHNITQILNMNRAGAWSRSITAEHNVLFYSNLNKGLINSMTGLIVLPSGDNIWKQYVAISNLLPATEAEGIIRAVGSSFFPSCQLSDNFHRWIIELIAKFDYLVDTALVFNNDLSEVYEDLLQEIPGIQYNLSIMTEELIDRNYVYVCMNQTETERVMKGLLWFNTITTYINAHLALLTHAINNAVASIDSMAKGTNKTHTIFATILAVVCVGCLVLGIWYTSCINTMTGQIIISKYASVLSIKTKELTEEKKRTEKLLYQMLPKSIAGSVNICIF